MKIVFIGGRDIHLIGGIESYMYNLASTLVRFGHHPIVFCESDRNMIRFENGIKVVYQKGPRSNLICKPLLGLIATVRALVTERHISVIHYNAWPPALACWIPRVFGVRSLMQGHGLEWQRTKYSGRQQKIMKLMECVTAFMNQHLIMCSEAQSKYFKERYNKDAPTIPTAINIPEPDADDGTGARILSEYGLVPGRYFLFMSRLVQDKNPDYLIRAFGALDNKGCKLVIAGDKEADRPYVEKLRELAAGNSSIVFTGAVYGRIKDVLFRNAYAYCLPSSIEGLSISLLEAMSYKLPIIASDIEANREVLPRDNAVWVKPEDTGELLRGLQCCMDHHRELIDRCSRENYRIVLENYTWDAVAGKYLEYLKSIGVK